MQITGACFRSREFLTRGCAWLQLIAAWSDDNNVKVC